MQRSSARQVASTASAKVGQSAPAKTEAPPGGGGVGDRRLWSSLEARAQWRGYVEAAATFSQLGVAVSSLRDHVAGFGLLGKRVDGAARAAAVERCVQVWDALRPSPA